MAPIPLNLNQHEGAGLSFFLSWLGPWLGRPWDGLFTTHRPPLTEAADAVDLKETSSGFNFNTNWSTRTSLLTYLRCGGRHHDHKFSKAKVTVTIKAALQSFQTPSGPAPLLRWNGGTWVIWSTYSNLAHLPKVYVIAMVVFVSSSDRLFRSDIIGCILNEKSNQNP